MLILVTLMHYIYVAMNTLLKFILKVTTGSFN